MSIIFYASERHYADHLWPVFTRWTDTARLADWFHDGDPQLLPECLGGRTVVVSAFKDLITARKAKAAKVVLMQHGAGQSYSNRHSSYPGGSGHARASLVLMPNEQAAERHRKYHPKVPVEVVGCPKLDSWVHRPFTERDRPYIAVSFHWRCTVALEAGTVWDDYGRDVLASLRSSADSLNAVPLVHAHPKIADEVAEAADEAGLPFVESFRHIMDRAAVYVCDNSSTMFEFAALDRPVVVMNSPRWRRNVHHGGRFWDWAGIGANVDSPGGVTAAIAVALGGDLHAEARRAVVSEVYPHLGEAADRAVAAIAALEGS